MLILVFKALAILGYSMWIGGFVAVTHVMELHLGALEQGTSLRNFRAVERSLLMRATLPGAVLMVGSGIALIGLSQSEYVGQVWFYGACAAIAGAVALTVVVARRVFFVIREPTRMPRSHLPRNARVVLLALSAIALIALFPLRSLVG